MTTPIINAPERATSDNAVCIVSYVAWESATIKGARVTIAGTALTDDSDIAIASGTIADLQRKPSGEVDLLILANDPANQAEEVGAQLIAAALLTFDPARWLADLALQGGWWSAMADGRVGIGFSRCHYTDEQMTEARRMIGALSDSERDAVEHLIRARAGVEVMA